MERSETIHTTTTTGFSGPPDLLTPILRFLGEGFSFNLFEGIAGFLGTIWSVYTIIAYALSFLFLYIFIYSRIQSADIRQQKKDMLANQEAAWQKLHGKPAQQTRFSVIQERIESTNPNDWKLAIIEADILLDEALKRNGFVGTSLGERLKSVSAQNLQSLDDAWEAHKVRNKIAHAGEDFILTNRIAKETIARYRNVFEELGLL